MAKTFYSAEEAAERLGTSEDELKNLVRDGKLREFRDAGAVTYKVSDVDAIAGSTERATVESAAGGSASGTAAGASATGEIVLEPADDSSIELAPSTDDVLALDGLDAADTSPGGVADEAAKSGSAVPSIGVNVFDDDELDDEVDPLAQTAVTDVAGLGIEGAGSGSGILDLTRESDDTSLGAELLEEIYTGDDAETEEAAAEEQVEAGEDTRAGLDEALTDTAEEGEELLEAEDEEPATATAEKPGMVVREVVEHAPDAVSSALTALLAVSLVVLWFAGLGAAALVRGSMPAILKSIYANLLFIAGGAVLAGVMAAAVTYFVAKRSK
jgi:hypothetical protein